MIFNFGKSSEKVSSSSAIDQIFDGMKKYGYSIEESESDPNRYIAESEDLTFVVEVKDQIVMFRIFREFTDKINAAIEADPMEFLEKLNAANFVYEMVNVVYFQGSLVFKSHLRLDQSPVDFMTFQYQFVTEVAGMLSKLES